MPWLIALLGRVDAGYQILGVATTEAGVHPALWPAINMARAALPTLLNTHEAYELAQRVAAELVDALDASSRKPRRG